MIKPFLIPNQIRRNAFSFETEQMTELSHWGGVRSNMAGGSHTMLLPLAVREKSRNRSWSVRATSSLVAMSSRPSQLIPYMITYLHELAITWLTVSSRWYSFIQLCLRLNVSISFFVHKNVRRKAEFKCWLKNKRQRHQLKKFQNIKKSCDAKTSSTLNCTKLHRPNTSDEND